MSEQIETKQDLLKPPGADEWDVVHAAVKAGLSAVEMGPGIQVGPPAAELFASILEPPIMRRRVRWVQAIAARLLELERKVEGFKLENLRENPLFLSVVLHASQVAMRAHQEEKLQALQNAVVNSACGIDIEENMQLIFVEMIDRLTPLHLRILKYFDQPMNWLQREGVSDIHYYDDRDRIKIWERFGTPIPIDSTYFHHRVLSFVTGRIRLDGSDAQGHVLMPQETSQQAEMCDAIVMDLFSLGLIDVNKESLRLGGRDGILSPHTTQLGKRFLRYIESV